MVGGMFSMLPYDTGICCYTFILKKIIIFLLLLSIPFFKILFLNLVLINRRKCFFNRGNAEGTNSSNILCPMFVYVLFYVNLCHD